MQLNGEYEHIALGEIALKGKNEKVVLYPLIKPDEIFSRLQPG